MFYYVHNTDGGRMGPADTATLHDWAQRRLFGAAAMVEDASTGACFPATELPDFNHAIVDSGRPMMGLISIHAEIGHGQMGV